MTVSGRRRFISADPLGHTATPDLYSYALGDPINFFDPTGRVCQSFHKNQDTRIRTGGGSRMTPGKIAARRKADERWEARGGWAGVARDSYVGASVGAVNGVIEAGGAVARGYSEIGGLLGADSEGMNASINSFVHSSTSSIEKMTVDYWGADTSTEAYRNSKTLGGFAPVGGVAGKGSSMVSKSLSRSRNNSSNLADDFITVFRGDQPGTKVIKSKAAIQGGYKHSQNLIDNGDLSALFKQHASSSDNPASPFISVTTDRRVAEYFAGPNGVVNEFQIPMNRAFHNPHNNMVVPAASDGSDIIEAEWLVPNYIRPSEFVKP